MIIFLGIYVLILIDIVLSQPGMVKINIKNSFLNFKFISPKGKPIIKSVQQLTENSVEIKWSVPQIRTSERYLLTRYRVQISSDNFTYDIREWPCKYSFLKQILYDFLFYFETFSPVSRNSIRH
jgi:hypothetical protein